MKGPGNVLPWLSGATVLRSDAMEWQSIGIEGIETQCLGIEWLGNGNGLLGYALAVLRDVLA